MFAYGIVADNDSPGASVANRIEFNIPHNPTTNIQNEKDIVNQNANKNIGKKHYDRSYYIIEEREVTIKWKKAMQNLLTNDGIAEIQLIIEKEREL
ncbi:MAG TPA: hypothetical protein DCM34_00295 [Salmonella bongori]|uniref:Uncharacterized protein n=3 Tax=Salmonella bongori TaxID=54736 RepID=A0A0K0HD65_SALBC|nr:hypothetical protein [Salmonella bongori]ASG53919.1 hypothetical protein LFZ56_06300 [Salmonella bongori serovar 66:z41:- str. SA19983605]ECC9752351.1 hypothetical protein [Salmonella bongori]EDP8561635.1 hypothetical protein [Salmonella bongori]EDP8605471.1 hypothetical protein [Salmonella bongori]EDP8648098.1 hypothetical protein [Salmonella bongori]